MPSYSPHPVTVDGISLDTIAYNIESKIRAWPGARAADVAIPGVDGVTASLNDDLDSTTWTLSMWVLGNDTTGAVPGGSTPATEYRKNLDALSHLFIGRRNALLDVRETVDNAGTIRQAYGKVVDVIAPETRAGVLGKFGVSLLIPEGMAQDVSTADWATTPTVVSGTAYEVTTLASATAPISDAILLVTGPINTPKITDTNTGAYVQLNQNLSGTQFWRVNCGTWATRYGTSLGLGSADTTGTDGQASTVFGGGNARFLRMLPVLSSGVRRVSLSLTGTAITAGTALSVRARRKYLQ